MSESGEATASEARVRERRRAVARATETAGKPRDRAKLKRQSEELNALFLKRALVPEKILVQAELGSMRRQLMADRRTVDITYPVNPPYAFVHVFFDNGIGEFQYVILEPTLKPGEKETMGKVREKMEAMMAHEELPISETLNLEQSPELREYPEGEVPRGTGPLRHRGPR